MNAPAPCGSWSSPITIDALLAAGTGLQSVGVDGNDVYWLESRPDDDGRTVLVKASDGEPVVVTPGANVRGRVQEYGGGTWHAAEGIVVWCNDLDASVHVTVEGTDRQLTPSNKALAYGDLLVVPRLRRVLAVREDHRGDGEAVTQIVALNLDGSNDDGGVVLATGADFYAHPVLSDDDQLAWVEWMHPNMPWHATRLMVATLAGDRLVDVAQVAGTATTDPARAISVMHPRWVGSRLVHLSDETGHWNPWLWEAGQRRQLVDLPGDFCRPLWVLGNALYAVVDPNTLAMMRYDDARARLGLVHLDGTEPLWDSETLADVDSIAAGPAGIFAVVDHDDRHAQVIRLDEQLRRTPVREAADEQPEAGYVSRPESIWFDGAHGRTQAWYYPPTSATARPADGELPPMVVNTHGGPTGMATSTYNSSFQFWTSRGFAVLDVNYSGSAGFGRAYRDRLERMWGIADIDDCRDAVAAIVDRGLADPERVVIQGGSAGGYTTLQALVSTDIFAAGVSRYGIGDLEMLVGDTHKFESRYPYKLVGSYPQDQQVYVDRSPIHHVDRLSSPMLILQGMDDKVVPPNQAVAMADAVRAKGLPVALVMFEGEGHGFRRLATRRAVLEAQLSFFSQLFGFTPADAVPTLEIENL